jgi:F-type H+-transporting ATPase subunit b
MEESVNWIKVAYAFLNFAALLGLLIWKGGPGIAKWLRQRHKTIRTELDEAQLLRETAQAKLTEYEERLKNIEQEIADMVAGIQKEAESEAARIVAAAEESARRIQRDAELLIKQETRRVELELRRESANLAVAMAQKLLQERMQEADQKRLADTFVTEMQARASRAGGQA